ncbi:hypothetical protein Bca101_021150 [Brassica carinata]
MGEIAQHRMKQQADLHQSERRFEVGDWVYVKLQPYRQHTVVQRGNHKLSPKYFGPYCIEDKVGKVAYKLRLPKASQIHSVFHVSQLKRAVGDVSSSTQLPSIVADITVRTPEEILARKMVKRQGRAATLVLVKGTGQNEEEATWELLFDL